MIELTAFTVVAKALVLALGGVLTHLAYRAFRRTGAPPLRALAIGFGVVTAGAVLGGLLDVVFGVGLVVGVLVESTFTAVGFAVIAYSVFHGGAARAV